MGWSRNNTDVILNQNWVLCFKNDESAALGAENFFWGDKTSVCLIDLRTKNTLVADRSVTRDLFLDCFWNTIQNMFIVATTDRVG